MSELTREQVIEITEENPVYLDKLALLRQTDAALRDQLAQVQKESESRRTTMEHQATMLNDYVRQLADASATIKRLSEKIAQQRRCLSGKNELWASTKLGLLREIERWRSKAQGEVPTFGHGAKRDELTYLQARVHELEAALKAKETR